MIELPSDSGSIPIADDYIGDTPTLLINLDEVPLGDVLTRRDSALTQAIQRQRELRSGSTDDPALVAGFNNFVG